MRTGIGWDSHRLAEGLPLVLGGVRIEHTHGLDGHSDADVLAHPDLVKHWGSERPWPDRDLRYYYEIAMEGIADSGIAIELSTAGLRKPVGELYPSEPFLEMVVDAGNPIVLSSDAHTPDVLGYGYEAAVAQLERVGVKEIGVFEGRQLRLEPLG